MTYQPQPGDVGLTQIDGPVGLAIRIGQAINGGGFADFEHAFVVAEVIPAGDFNQPCVWIVEAEPGGAREALLSEYDVRTVVWLRCPEQYRHKVAQAALGLVKTPYSAADYFAIAAHRLHLPVPGLRNYVKSSGHLICSQLCDRAAAMGGWHLFADERWDGYVTPADLWGLIRKQDAATPAPVPPKRPVIPGTA